MFAGPTLSERELEVAVSIEELLNVVRSSLRQRHQWHERFGRLALARSVQAWESLAKRQVTIEDAATVVDGLDPTGLSQQEVESLRGNRDVFIYVRQATADPDLEYGPTLLKSIHFILMRHRPETSPGLLRPAIIFRSREDPLVDSSETRLKLLLGALQEGRGPGPSLVNAGMAHLNLVALRPFHEGNAEIARALQMLVLAREWSLEAWICGIDEYVESHASTYYSILEEVGASRRSGIEDVRPWIRFLMTAHYRSAHKWEQRIAEADRLWDALERERERHHLDSRVMPVLYDAAMGLTVRRKHHIESSGVSDRVASSDLKGLVEAGVLRAIGDKRGRVYVADRKLRGLRRDSWSQRPPLPDPFE